MWCYQLVETVVLRAESFGGMAFYTERAITLELDAEAYQFLSSFGTPRTFPESSSASHMLASQLRRLGFLKRVSVERVLPTHPFEDSIQGNSRDTLAAPEIVHLALTARCDLTCSGCYAFLGKEMLSWPMLRNLIDQLAEMRVFQLALGGGEPTLHPYLIDIVAYARQRNIVPNITTHGGHLTPVMIKSLYQAGVGQVNISLNAHAPEHNSGRGERPWQLAMHGLEQLQGSGIQTGINCLVTTQNLIYLEDLLSFLITQNVRHITILGPKPANDPQWLTEHQLGEDAYVQLGNILRQWQEHLNITVDCALVGCLMKTIDPDTLQKAGIYGCMAAQRMCVIDAKGNVWPCAFQQSPQFCAGNILTTPFRDIWLHGSGFQVFRDLQCGGMTPCYQCIP